MPGLAGMTERELAGLLRIQDSRAAVHDTLASLRRGMVCEAGRGGGTLDIQDSLVCGPGDTALLPAYADLARNVYDVKTSKSSSADPSSLIQSLTLINLMIFKDTWQTRFDASDTKNASFFLLNGTETKIPTMSQRYNKIARYVERDDFEALEMCYEGESLSMVVLLPKKKKGLPEFEQALTSEKLAEWLSKLDTWKWGIHIYLPRFAMTAHHELNSHLETMGLKSAFARGTADFSALVKPEWLPMWVSRTQQEILLEVDEKGSKAIAVSIACSSISGSDGGDSRPRRKMGEPIIFRADHPFMFIIRHNPSGCILFMGRVVNPAQ
jgi:serpin B